MRVAVVGGGLTGLAAAFRWLELAQQHERPLELTLFEASARSGGVIGTQSIQGYTVELGADSFITNKPWALRLCQRLGLEADLIPTNARYRRSLVLRKGKPVEVPEGFQLLTPGKLWPIVTTPIFSWRGKLRMAWEYFLPGQKVAGDESLAHFVRRRFGQEVLDRLVQPLVGGIYTSDPEQLSLRATLPRFLDMEQQHGSLIRAMRAEKRKQPQQAAAQGARYDLFLTLRRGIGQLLSTLAERVAERGRIQLQTRVTGLRRHDGGGWELTAESSSGTTTQAFDRVVLALPAYRAAELLQPQQPELAGELNAIPYASSAIVVSGYPLSQVQNPCNAFGLVIPAVERRRILAISFTSRKFPDRAPEGHIELRTFVGGAMQPEMFQLPDSDIYRLVREELHDLLGVTGEPVFETLARYPRAMPQYHVGHLERVARIRQLAGGLTGLALAGNAYDGVGMPDSIRSAEQAVESLWDAK